MHAPHLPHSKQPALTVPILVGIAFGVLARAVLLRIDRRPFPTHPHGRINYLFLGLVAAVLGALAPPALLTADYTSGVFLAIGLAQFHTVRDMERNMLLSLEDAQLVPRGKAYIEGIALMLETRNYLSMMTAMLATSAAILWGSLAGAAVGLASAVAAGSLARLGRSVGAVATAQAAEVQVRKGDLCVAGVPVWHEPPTEAMDQLPHAVGVTVAPRDMAARLTLAQPGQQQAMVYDMTAHLGLRGVPGSDEPPAALHPRHAVDPATGKIAILLFPQAGGAGEAAEVARHTPLLETLSVRWLKGLPSAHPGGGAPGGGHAAAREAGPPHRRSPGSPGSAGRTRRAPVRVQPR